MLTSATNIHLMFPDVYVSPESLQKQPILLNVSPIHSIDFSTILQKLKAACRMWKSCIRLVLVSTRGRPGREQRSSSSCEATKTINPVPERKRKHIATLCSTAVLHLIFQSIPHGRELDPAKSMRALACISVRCDKTSENVFPTLWHLSTTGHLRNRRLGKLTPTTLSSPLKHIRTPASISRP